MVGWIPLPLQSATGNEHLSIHIVPVLVRQPRLPSRSSRSSQEDGKNRKQKWEWHEHWLHRKKIQVWQLGPELHQGRVWQGCAEETLIYPAAVQERVIPAQVWVNVAWQIGVQLGILVPSLWLWNRFCNRTTPCFGFRNIWTSRGLGHWKMPSRECLYAEPEVAGETGLPFWMEKKWSDTSPFHIDPFPIWNVELWSTS